MLFEEASSGIPNRKSANSPASRARCWSLIPKRPPVVWPFQAALLSRRLP